MIERRLRAAKQIVGNDVLTFYLTEVDTLTGTFYQIAALERKERNPAEECDPICHLPVEAAQILMDDLWACGIRPTEGAGSAGAMAATQKHLNDMRALNDKLLAQLFKET